MANMWKNEKYKILVIVFAICFCFPCVSFGDDTTETLESDWETPTPEPVSETPEEFTISDSSGDHPQTEMQENLQLLEEELQQPDVIGKAPDRELIESINNLQVSIQKLQESTDENTKSVEHLYKVYNQSSVSSGEVEQKREGQKSGETETPTPEPATLDDLHVDNLKIMVCIFFGIGAILGFFAFKSMFDRRI